MAREQEMKRKTSLEVGYSLADEYLRTRRRSRARNTVQGRKKSVFFVSIAFDLERSRTGNSVAESVLIVWRMVCCRCRRGAEAGKDRVVLW